MELVKDLDHAMVATLLVVHRLRVSSVAKVGGPIDFV